uniref:Protein kinase domain-containing protein n=1 Tax=Oryzias sinensis TaxID=183150 RepID=A0A8C7XMK5_9TELE
MTENSFEVQENFILRSHEGVYIVEKFLGEGTFGKVAKCTNLSTNKEVAIKIIKKGFNHTAQDEIKAMIEISKIDAHKYNLVKCVDWFHYKSHVCMVFEMLDQSLFDFMKDRRSRPLFVQEIRDIAWQLLVSLKGLKSINLVHCDIKLDNIMLVNQASEPFRVKLIDFGAPEVILGLPLDERGQVKDEVDCWSFDELKYVYCDETKMEEVEQLIDLLKQMLEVDPNKRISPNDALRHPFFKLEMKKPSTTKSQESAAAEVHQQPEAKEVSSVPQRPKIFPLKVSLHSVEKSPK